MFMQTEGFTRDHVFAKLYNTVPEVMFGLREPDEDRYIPPTTLWERIKQVWQGPKKVKRTGELEIAIIGSVVSESTVETLKRSMGNSIPVGVLVTYVRYAGVDRRKQQCI
jgi:hypothetical protein